ncbi:Rieske (2Fe-2S) protein [Marinibaculum pumilum]|uniref:Rieske (2Fe-2S) protein n=1 Tax=Marinibaculum pumilum TaxID=1766165 RepID=A0ABV7KW04_9PROT
MSGWQEVATLAAFPESGLLDLAVGREVVLLLRLDDTVQAFQGLCPHQFARLAEGRAADGWLHCPRHRARFAVSDGHCGAGWVLPPLRRYAVQVDAEGRILLPDPLVPLPPAG